MIHTNVDTEIKYVKMKKDVYEHLAKTFLEKKSQKKFSNKQLWLFSILIVISCLLSILLLSLYLSKKGDFSKSIFVIEDKTPIGIEYDFSTMGNNKVRAISYNLNSIDLGDYRYLSLAARTQEKSDSQTALKVQVENSLREKDSRYISGINSEWRSFTIPLSDFAKIKDWSKVGSLTFLIEEWNTGIKKDKVYIDDVKFITELEN
jgi:hypothetical protein